MLLTSGICAWITKEPGPLPWVPGSGSEFSPCQPQPDIPATATVVNRIIAKLAAVRRRWSPWGWPAYPEPVLRRAVVHLGPRPQGAGPAKAVRPAAAYSGLVERS